VAEDLRNLESLSEEIGELIGSLLNTHTNLFMLHSAQIIDMARDMVLVCFSIDFVTHFILRLI
jgi:hypothetical protein